jgi:hypothetical protein
MLSYDYCHFEIALSSDNAKTMEDANNMRKQAQRLADEAVRQYKAHMEYLREIDHDEQFRERIVQMVKNINLKPKPEWTPEDKATVKHLKDMNYRAAHRYNFDDDDEPDFGDEEW